MMLIPRSVHPRRSLKRHSEQIEHENSTLERWFADNNNLEL